MKNKFNKTVALTLLSATITSGLMSPTYAKGYEGGLRQYMNMTGKAMLMELESEGLSISRFEKMGFNVQNINGNVVLSYKGHVIILDILNNTIKLDGKTVHNDLKGLVDSGKIYGYIKHLIEEYKLHDSEISNIIDADTNKKLDKVLDKIEKGKSIPWTEIEDIATIVGKEDEKPAPNPGKEDEKPAPNPGKEDEKPAPNPGKEDEKPTPNPGKEDEKPAPNPGKEDEKPADEKLNLNIMDKDIVNSISDMFKKMIEDNEKVAEEQAKEDKEREFLENLNLNIMNKDIVNSISDMFKDMMKKEETPAPNPGKEDEKPAPNPGKEDEKPAPNPGKEDEEKPAPNPGKEDEKPVPNPGKEDEKPAPNPGKEDEEQPAPNPGKEDEKPVPNPGNEDKKEEDFRYGVLERTDYKVVSVELPNGQRANLKVRFLPGLSKEHFKYVNEFRRENGLPELKEADSRLQKVADERAAELAYNYFEHLNDPSKPDLEHVRSNGMKPGDSIQGYAGENILYGNSYDKNDDGVAAEQTFETFKNSDGHRENMLYNTTKEKGSYPQYERRMAVSTVEDYRNPGMYFQVQMFGQDIYGDEIYRVVPINQKDLTDLNKVGYTTPRKNGEDIEHNLVRSHKEYREQHKDEIAKLDAKELEEKPLSEVGDIYKDMQRTTGKPYKATTPDVPDDYEGPKTDEHVVVDNTDHQPTDQEIFDKMKKDLERPGDITTNPENGTKEDKTEVKEDKTEVKEDKTEVKEDKTEVKEEKTEVKEETKVASDTTNTSETVEK